MQLRIGTLVKLFGNSIIYRVGSRITREGLLDQYNLVNNTSDEAHPTSVTLFDVTIVDNRQLYIEVLDFKIENKKAILTKINKDLKKFRIIKKELTQYSSDEEEVAAFITSFKTATGKDILKLIKNKEHIDFQKFLIEWV